MQTPTLSTSPMPSRADGQFIRGAGGDAFRRQFESLTNPRNTNQSHEIVYQPQDERTIRKSTDPRPQRPDHGTVNRSGPEQTQEGREASAESDSRNTKTAEAASTKREEPESQAEPKEKDRDDGAAAAKARKPADADENNEQAALMAAGVAVQQPADAPPADETASADAAAKVVAAADLNATEQTSEALALAKNTEAATNTENGAEGAAAAGPSTATTKAKPGAKLDATTMDQSELTDGESQANTPIEKASTKQNADQDASDLLSQSGTKPTADAKPADDKANASSFDKQLQTLQNYVAPQAKTDVAASSKLAPPPNLTPEQKFVRDNVDQVVTSVRTQSLQGGGQMHVRLDPPELGALQVAVKMIDGRLTASFTTSNEQATQLLSHSLQHLKSSLEASGVSVDRIEVRQAPPSEQSSSRSSSDSNQQNQQRGFDAHSQQSEQHRKEMVRKMWRKLAYGSDDLDLVA